MASEVFTGSSLSHAWRIEDSTKMHFFTIWFGVNYRLLTQCQMGLKIIATEEIFVDFKF